MKYLLFFATLVYSGRLFAANEGPEVLIVSQAQPSLPMSLQPEPGKPIYYLLVGNKELDVGYSQASFGPQPDVHAIEAELIKVLAKQGFIKTKVGGPLPHFGLAFFWGEANNMDPPPFERNPSPKLRRLVGADKIRTQDLTLVEGYRVASHVYTNRVYITVVALDLRSLVRKKPVLLWRTRISVESINHDLTDSFTLMLAGAAPYFGRTTDKPVFIGDRDRAVKVEFGELKVLELDAKPPADEKPAHRERKK